MYIFGRNPFNPSHVSKGWEHVHFCGFFMQRPEFGRVSSLAWELDSHVKLNHYNSVGKDKIAWVYIAAQLSIAL